MPFNANGLIANRAKTPYKPFHSSIIALFRDSHPAVTFLIVL
jgi:hypothetical protein